MNDFYCSGEMPSVACVPGDRFPLIAEVELCFSAPFVAHDRGAMASCLILEQQQQQGTGDSFAALAAEEMRDVLNCTYQVHPTVVRGVDSVVNHTFHRLVIGYKCE